MWYTGCGSTSYVIQLLCIVGRTWHADSVRRSYVVVTSCTTFFCNLLDKPLCSQHTHTTHPSNGPFSGTTRVSRYQKGKTNLDFTEARDSEWQWHQLGHMQVCTSLQTDNHASTPPLSFLQAGCPSCRPTNSVKALKAKYPSRTLVGKFAMTIRTPLVIDLST